MWLVLLLLLPATTLAAGTGDAGSLELNALTGIVTGNIGLFLGLLITVWGIFKLVGGETGAGMMLMILGVLLTIFPGVFNVARSIVVPVAQGITGG
ncbi:MAG: hypothetical protein H6922_05710 [Pseudomonadaceae bacterium]|nr:hypothetical protein [Pseudomonadaceae bacterium]